MTYHGTCSECNRPLNDGEYFILNGDGTGIHHECPTHCPICGERIAHDDQTVFNGDICHFDCVREINEDLDAQDEGCPECGEMDGDHESALASAGFGTDEDYGFGGYDD